MFFLTSIYINLMLASFYQVKKVTYYFTIFLFSILFFSFSSFASCIKIEDDKFVFLPPDDTICTDKATGGILKLYSNPDSSASDNKLDTIIEGRSGNGYSMHFTFDRDESDNFSGDQILFAAYEDMSDGTAVAKAGIRSGEFFYEIGSEEINGVNMSALNDVSVSNPHIAIIVYDSRRQKVILNIDGAEVISKNIKPISGISKISRIEFGKNYTGEMGMMYTYATKLSIQERVELVGMLAHSVNVRVINPKIDERGVLVSGVDKEAAVQCRPGKIFINGNCQNAVISGFTAPLNSAYDGDSNGDITYDPAHKGMDNAKLLDCNIGYEVGSVSPKYWFTLNGDLPSVHTEGSCVEKFYTLATIPSNMRDPGSIGGLKLLNATYDNPKKASCFARYNSSSNILGVYVDNNDNLQVVGDCSVYSGADPACYTAPIRSIGQWDGCLNKLIVDAGMLISSKNDNSFDFKPSDTYTSHNNGITYTFALNDGTNNKGNIFTGRITNLNAVLSYKSFNEDISHWDVSSVTSMYQFLHKSTFNNPSLANWDIRSVTNMVMVFAGTPFNQDLSNWDVSNVTYMDGLFLESSFNNNSISNWDVSKITNFSNMFSQSTFNQNLSKWDVSNATIFQGMFAESSRFNNDSISNWNVKNVTNMHKMFVNNKFFNQDLSNWNTNSVTNMAEMFYGSVFNQDISGWCVKNVTNSSSFSAGSPLQTAFHPPFGDSTSTNCN